MIDTHCHVDDEVYASDFDEFVSRQKQAGVECILVPGVNVGSLRTVPAVCARYPDYLLPALGLHPEEIGLHYESDLQMLYAALHQSRWIAVGEIGLDYHFDTTYKMQQQEAFRTQLQWAVEEDLPVMIHSRDATEDCLRLLQEVHDLSLRTAGLFPLRGVMHCFSGSGEVARRILKMGLHLGIGGVITFKNAKLAQHLEGIPLEALVLETDAPYLAPVPHRGERNESVYMIYVARRLAEVYGCTEEQVLDTTTATAKRLFRL